MLLFMFNFLTSPLQQQQQKTLTIVSAFSPTPTFFPLFRFFRLGTFYSLLSTYNFIIRPYFNISCMWIIISDMCQVGSDWSDSRELYVVLSLMKDFAKSNYNFTLSHFLKLFSNNFFNFFNGCASLIIMSE